MCHPFAVNADAAIELLLAAGDSDADTHYTLLQNARLVLIVGIVGFGVSAGITAFVGLKGLHYIMLFGPMISMTASVACFILVIAFWGNVHDAALRHFPWTVHLSWSWILANLAAALGAVAMVVLLLTCCIPLRERLIAINVIKEPSLEASPQETPQPSVPVTQSDAIIAT
jgi:hypothetical protein